MPFIAGGARTGIGKFMGSLSGFPATELGGIAIAGALDKAGVAPSEASSGAVATQAAGVDPLGGCRACPGCRLCGFVAWG